MKTVSIVLLLFLGLINTAQSQSRIEKVKKGSKAYDFKALDSLGNSFQLSDFEGKYVLLNFTATRCGPCWEAYPQMNALQDEYGDKLKVISFHSDEEKDLWNTMTQKRGLAFNYITVWNVTKKTEVLDIYNIDGFPSYFLINPEGVVVAEWFGNSRIKLRNNVKKHLAKKS